MTLKLVDGSEAIADAAIAAGLRFYAGYPMAPATDLLEHMSRKLPKTGGVCINADTEIEGVNMVLGAGAVGARAATGSTGQGVALMQEAIAEGALNETPMVIFTVARNQQDYNQCTRGGGWGDYNTPTLAPKDVAEAVEHTQLLFHWADKYRTPCILLADHIIARTQVSLDMRAGGLSAAPSQGLGAGQDSLGGSGRSRQHWTWGRGKRNTLTPGGVNAHWNRIAAKFDTIAEQEAMSESDGLYRGCRLGGVFVGHQATKFVEHVVRALRAEGKRVGYFRPITLWPFPGEALHAATLNAKRIAVFELNAGQMYQDVMIHVENRKLVRKIGGVSSDPSGLNMGVLMSEAVIREKIESMLSEAAS